jgi:hypothetical protein
MGRTIGYVLPASESERELSAWAQAQFTDEELQQDSSEPGGKTTAAVLAALERSA